MHLTTGSGREGSTAQSAVVDNLGIGVVQRDGTSCCNSTLIEEQSVVVDQVEVCSLNGLAFLIIQCRRLVSQCQGVGHLDSTFVPKGRLLV